jgi:F-type H+-transporting ATPase subunit alpha
MSTSPLLEDLRARFATWDPSAKSEEVGVVERVADGIASISGLPKARAGELLHIHTPQGPCTAQVLNLEPERIGAIILGLSAQVETGQTVITTGTMATVQVGQSILGRVLNGLGEPVDGKGALTDTESMPVERLASTIIARESVHQPLQTGITAIDTLIPIGRGQRELIIGDRGTGKTSIAIDTIINQVESGVVCIYVAIGQKESKVARLCAQLEEHGAMANTVVVTSSAAEPAALQYLAPYIGCAIGEYFMLHGQDALIVYDDLSKHAWAYRELSLLLRRPPGREAYPSDVFYLHSRLLERAAKLNPEHGGGSLTALPIIETQANDIAAYIPTNVISITDGQIYLESDLFYQGIRPAVNAGLSVSRVGGAAQLPAMKKVAGQIRLELAQYRELASFAQFGADLDETTRKQIERGKRLTELLKQPPYSPVPVTHQVVLLFAVTKGFMDMVPTEKITLCAQAVRDGISDRQPAIFESITTSGKLEEPVEAQLRELLPSLIQPHAVNA